MLERPRRSTWRSPKRMRGSGTVRRRFALPTGRLISVAMKACCSQLRCCSFVPGKRTRPEKWPILLMEWCRLRTSPFARLIEGEIALTRKRLNEAVESLREGQKRYDSWFAHFLLGRAYLQSDAFPEALSEFELCVKRKGEAMDVFFLDGSTIRYFPPAHYWLGRAQEGVGATDAARKSYDEFLALRAHADTSDPLVADARKRAGQLGAK